MLKRKYRKKISKNVLSMSFVSLFNDIASEMIYPLLPIFLSSLTGVSAAAFLGIIEGVAESMASVLKYFFGVISDKRKEKKKFAVIGYTISNLVRPLIGLAKGWGGIFIFRAIDRVGKGIRTAPRDALIASSTDSKNQGFAYSFHRSMDNLGALIGPILASAILLLNNNNIKSIPTVFFLSIIPGIIAVLIFIFAVKEKKVARIPHIKEIDKTDEKLPKPLIFFIVSLIIFTLGNSSDAFLLLKAKSSKLSIALIPILWSFFHLFKISVAPLAGIISDRLGRKKILVVGWLIYAVSYILFSLNHTSITIWFVFALYGLYYALTEGVQKAYVSDLASKNIYGKAFGAYNFSIGIGKLPSSLLFGFLWVKFSPHVAFLTGAGFSLIASLFLVTTVRSMPR